MANVLILTLLFPPNGVSTALIVGEIAVDLKKRGHRVTVVTTVPHYNRDAEAESRQPLRRIWGPFLYESEFHGVPVYHTAMPRKSGNRVLRVLAWSLFHLLSTIAALVRVRRVDVIMAPSPPLTVGVCAWLLGRWYRAPYVYNVQELYPDIVIRLGALKNRWLIRLLYRLEKFVYDRAAAVTAIAPRMAMRLREKQVPDAKIRVIPNFVDLEELPELPKANPFSRTHGIDRKFVITYAGNMGPAQGLESLVRAAGVLRERTELCFLLIGDGICREALKRQASDLGLSNVLVLPYEPYAVVPQIYAASDVCVVPQAATTGWDAVPSKVYRIMAAGRPVLACTDAASDLAALVRDAGCGVVVAPGSHDEIASAVANALDHTDEWRARGAAGKAHVTVSYSRQAITDRYDQLVKDTARLPRRDVEPREQPRSGDR